MKILISIIILFFCIVMLNAQSVLLEQNLKNDTVKKTFGQNRKHFIHLYGGFSFAALPAETDSVKLNYGLSNSLFFGISYKRKLSGFYSVGYNVAIYSLGYNIRQNENKRFIDDTVHKKEKLILTALSFELYNRFNFGKRGDIIGNYIDLGVFGYWVARSGLYLKDEVKLSGQDKLTPVEIKIRRLHFIETFGYGARLRFGINRYTITADYRFSDMFKQSSGLQELPRLFVGVQIGFY